MTDYEAKFHELGTKINRCVAVKDVLPPQPEPEGPETGADTDEEAQP